MAPPLEKKLESLIEAYSRGDDDPRHGPSTLVQFIADPFGDDVANDIVPALFDVMERNQDYLFNGSDWSKAAWVFLQTIGFHYPELVKFYELPRYLGQWFASSSSAVQTDVLRFAEFLNDLPGHLGLPSDFEPMLHLLRSWAPARYVPLCIKIQSPSRGFYEIWSLIVEEKISVYHFRKYFRTWLYIADSSVNFFDYLEWYCDAFAECDHRRGSRDGHSLKEFQDWLARENFAPYMSRIEPVNPPQPRSDQGPWGVKRDARKREKTIFFDDPLPYVTTAIPWRQEKDSSTESNNRPPH